MGVLFGVKRHVSRHMRHFGVSDVLKCPRTETGGSVHVSMDSSPFKRVLTYILHKMHNIYMSGNASPSEFRSEQGRYLDIAQREPVFILSRGTRRRAVVVSPDFYDRAVQALEDIEDIRAAAHARQEADEISHQALKAELGPI